MTILKGVHLLGGGRGTRQPLEWGGARQGSPGPSGWVGAAWGTPPLRKRGAGGWGARWRLGPSEWGAGHPSGRGENIEFICHITIFAMGPTLKSSPSHFKTLICCSFDHGYALLCNGTNPQSYHWHFKILICCYFDHCPTSTRVFGSTHICLQSEDVTSLSCYMENQIFSLIIDQVVVTNVNNITITLPWQMLAYLTLLEKNCFHRLHTISYNWEYWKKRLAIVQQRKNNYWSSDEIILWHKKLHIPLRWPSVVPRMPKSVKVFVEERIRKSLPYFKVVMIQNFRNSTNVFNIYNKGMQLVFLSSERWLGTSNCYEHKVHIFLFNITFFKNNIWFTVLHFPYW